MAPRPYAPAHTLEALEPRALLSGSAIPMPALADLQDPDHTVVRFETSLGVVDVELFDTAAPSAVASFLSRVGRGDLDRTIFDRLAPGAALEAGGYTLDPIAGVHPAPAGQTPADAAISNLARTVSARTGDVSSALRFNLADSAADADGAWTVIGRIADDASWSTLQLVAALPTADLRADLPGAAGSTLNAAPILDTGAPVSLIDAEVIKAAGEDDFFTRSIAYPEGFSGSTVDEFVPIINPNAEPAAYQVILRFERDPADPFAKRDAVVATGTIAASSRGGVTIWTGQADFPAATADSLITPGRPYAIEVRSTLPLAATLSHYDFGSATGEGFTADADTSWVMTDGVKGEGMFDFLVWHNAAASDAAVTVTLYPEGEAPLEPITITTEAYRRGGLDLSQIAALPDGRFAAMITSDQPVIAALSHYHPAGPVEGYTGLAARGPAVTGGAVPLARFGDTPDAGTITLSFINPAQPPEPCEHDHEDCDDNDDDDGHFVTICHRPPGNPDNVQILTIPLAALPAHLAHGDSLWTEDDGCACEDDDYGDDEEGDGGGCDEEGDDEHDHHGHGHGGPRGRGHHDHGHGHGHGHHGHDDDDSDDNECPPPDDCEHECPPVENRDAAITVTLRFEDESIDDVVLPDALILAPGRSAHLTLDSAVMDVTPYLGRRFTVLFSSDRPVYAGMSAIDGFDGVSTNIAPQGSMHSLFAEGFTDPARAGVDIFETVAIYNPAAGADPAAAGDGIGGGGGDGDANVTIRFRYTDGAVVEVQRAIVPGRTLFLDIHTLSEVLHEGEANHRYFYSIEVAAPVPVLTQMTHLDTNLGREGNAAGGFATMGMPMPA